MSDLIGTLSTEESLKGEIQDLNDLRATIWQLQILINDYEELINKPSIEGVTLVKNKTFSQLGLDKITNFDIENLLH